MTEEIGKRKKREKKALLVATVASMIDQFNQVNLAVLNSLGYEIEVACNFDHGNTCDQHQIEQLQRNLTARGIKFYNLPFPRSPHKFFSMLKAYQQLKSIILANNYDLIQTQAAVSSVLTRMITKDSQIKSKVIYTAHGFHFYHGAPLVDWLFYYPIEKYFSKYTTTLITINQEDYQLAKNNFKLCNVKLVSGIGLNLTQIKQRALATTTSIPWNDEDFVFLNVGELSKRKNQEVIIKALARIPDPKVKLAIAGQGKLAEKLQQLTLKLGLVDRVYFLGFRHDIIELLKKTQAFVFPSRQEGLPVALMEAMASGTLVIASDIRGNRDLITDKVSGFLVENNTTDDYVQAFKKVLNLDQATKMAMIERASQTIQEFSQEKVFSELTAIYED